MENPDSVVIQLGSDLIQLAIKNSATAVANKIKAIKASRKHERQIAELEDLVNELVSEKIEAIRIAKAYEETLVAQRITEEQIKYITGNIVPILDKLTPNNSEAINALKPLLSTEALTIMQLMGFNYKEAIGRPLTNLVKSAIEKKTKSINKGKR